MVADGACHGTVGLAVEDADGDASMHAATQFGTMWMLPDKAAAIMCVL